MKEFLKKFWIFRRTFIILIAPLLLLPIPLRYPCREGRCAYGLGIMAIYWITEALPIAVTALLPLVLFPFLGVANAKEISKMYLKDTNMLFFSGLIIAVAIEKWNLHRRIALRVLLIFGTQPKNLLLAFMIVTSTLSMFLSNTATAAMMVPIAEAVLTQLELETTDLLDERTPSLTNRKSFAKGLTLSICYSANIGGIATLTGTGPNIVLSDLVESRYKGEAGISFGSWFFFSFPTAAISLFFSYLWLLILFVGPKNILTKASRISSETSQRVRMVIQMEYNSLGPIAFAEWLLLSIFSLLVLLWLNRDPKIFPGWSSLFPYKFITDATCGITIAVLLFILPSQPPKWPFSSDAKSHEALLDFKTLQERLPWNVILILGGGMGLAHGCESSGLANVIGNFLSGLDHLSPSALCFILCLGTAAFTEVTSNVATTTLFQPIFAVLAENIGVHPLYLMVPTTIAASLAFMLPVATPPNSIAFAYGRLTVLDMVIAGGMLNVLCLAILTMGINSWGWAMFDLGQFPSWINVTNITKSSQYGC